MMRYVKPLPEYVKETLKEMHKNHPKSRARMRAHIILLSAEGYQIDEIANIYQIKRDTVCRCLTNWESQGLVGLLDKPKSGRPRVLTPEEEERACELIETDQRNSKKAQVCLEQETGKTISQWTFKRTLKRAGLRWKRMRRSLKKKQDPDRFAQGKKEIAQFKEQEERGEIGLYYFDESGVSTIPEVPYGWQPEGETFEMSSLRSKRINILGFCNRHNDFYYEIVEGWVKSEQVIDCFDSFADRLSKPTVVIVDNASIHTSKKFKAKCAQWATKGLTVYYLPTYSPELNLIEILWRFLKYHWMPLSAYENYKKLKECLIGILSNIGEKYSISFA